MSRCPDGHDNPDGNAFCYVCGAPIETAQISETDQGAPLMADQSPSAVPAGPTSEEAKPCPSCGSSGESGTYCSHCGQMLGDAARISGPTSQTSHTRTSVGTAGALTASLRGIPKWAWVLAAVLVLVAWLGGSRSRTLNGTLTLRPGEVVTESDCVLGVSGGFDDISLLSQVRVRDGSGAIIATGLVLDASASNEVRCVYSFTVDKVPKADFYSVEVGGSQRRGPVFSRTELDNLDWSVDLQLGS